MAEKKETVLTFIICSRNDNYMGEPMWRLATSVNYLSRSIFSLGRENETEIVLSDWGSTTPIAQVLNLTPQSAEITRFLHVPEEQAKELQKDSPFAEVLALNAAARASRGLFIGRIDQDTLVTENFIRLFFDAYEKKRDLGIDLYTSYMFAARKQLPYQFVRTKPAIAKIDYAISRFKNWIFSEELKFCYWASPVGILLMHRDMWYEFGGFDERLIYYWFMDVDLGTRIIKKYPIVNIGKLLGYDFFHLEHVKPGFRVRYSHRKLNPAWSKSFDKPEKNPNGTEWGLVASGFKTTELLVPPRVPANEATGHTTMPAKEMTILFFNVIKGTVFRWMYYQVKYLWYLSKKLQKKEYL